MFCVIILQEIQCMSDSWNHSLTRASDLKRFSQDFAFRSKLSTEVKCATKNLDLQKFSSEKGQENILHDFLCMHCSHNVRSLCPEKIEPLCNQL